MSESGSRKPEGQDGTDKRGMDASGGVPAGVGRRREERRRNVVDARNDAERAATGLERRRGPGRRRSDFVKAAEEGEMTPEQFLFIKAIDAYKRVNQTPFPTWTEVLEVIRKLGYRKTQATELEIPGAEDWLESGDAPAFVVLEAEEEREAA